MKPEKEKTTQISELLSSCTTPFCFINKNLFHLYCYQVLKLTVKGKDCYKKAIELALSLYPRNFHNVGEYTGQSHQPSLAELFTKIIYFYKLSKVLEETDMSAEYSFAKTRKTTCNRTVVK